jgi:hypothetical protein
MNQVVNSFSRAGFIGALSNLMMRRNEEKKKLSENIWFSIEVNIVTGRQG